VISCARSDFRPALNRPEVALALGPLVEIAFCDRLPGSGG
jgi:hypothetical protein